MASMDGPMPAQWGWRDDQGGLDMPLGERVKELRKERGWSQGELADKVGTDARQISRYENGRITPSLDVVARLAEVFNISLDYLVVEGAQRRPLTSRTTAWASASPSSPSSPTRTAPRS